MILLPWIVTLEHPLPPLNGVILVLSTIIENVLASTVEADLGALFYNAHDVTTIRSTVVELRHPQPPLQSLPITGVWRG